MRGFSPVQAVPCGYFGGLSSRPAKTWLPLWDVSVRGSATCPGRRREKGYEVQGTLGLVVLLWCSSAIVSCFDWKTAADQGATLSHPSMRRATVRAFESGATPPILTVQYQYPSPGDERELRLALTGLRPPSSYASVVQPHWGNACALSKGDEVDVAGANGLAIVVLRVSSGTSSEAPTRQLCFARTYFDLTETPEGGRGLHYVLGSIASTRASIPTWIRGPGAGVLGPYTRVEVMRGWALSHGQSLLVPSVEVLNDLATTLASRMVVAQIVPVRYDSPRDQLVGGWPYFVVKVFEERPDGTLALLADFSSLVR